MIYISTFLYYICFASIVLIYGIGLNKTSEIEDFLNKRILYVIKIIVSIFISSVLSWIVTSTILEPLHLSEIYPIICFLIFICINIFMESLIRLTSKSSTTEFIFSYLTVVLSVSESSSILFTLVICASCILSFALLMPFIIFYKKKISRFNLTYDVYYCRLLLFLAVLIFIISAWDVSWLNPGVLK